MTHPYSPPKSSLDSPPTEASRSGTSRLIVGFLSGFLGLPLLRMLHVLLIYIVLDPAEITFGTEDLPGLAGWIFLAANGALCGLCARRFQSYPLWLVALTGFILPLLLFAVAAVIAFVRIAA